MAASKYTRPIYVSAFGIEYLRNGGNISAAVRATFPHDKLSSSNATKVGARMLAHPDIQKVRMELEGRAARALSHAAERYGANADRAADELVRLAFTNLRDVVDWFTVTDEKTKARKQVVRVRDAGEITDDAHRAIAKISHKPDGTVTIELHDKQAAIMNLARLKGWIADKPEQPNNLVSFVIQR